MIKIDRTMKGTLEEKNYKKRTLQEITRMRHKNQTNQILYQTSKILYDHFRGKQDSKTWSDNGVISARTDHI